MNTNIINKISDDPVENTKEEAESNNLLQDTFVNPSNGFDCDKCDFVAKTEAGLKTHSKKKHKNNKNWLKQKWKYKSIGALGKQRLVSLSGVPCSSKCIYFNCVSNCY